jgi:hypothetical protein
MLGKSSSAYLTWLSLLWLPCSCLAINLAEAWFWMIDSSAVRCSKAALPVLCTSALWYKR